MYAVISTWMVPGTREENLEGLTSTVIPFVKALPGFVQAQFSLDPETGLSHNYLAFADKESAERFVTVSAQSQEMVESTAGAGVNRQGDFVIAEVLAEVDEGSIALPAN